MPGTTPTYGLHYPIGTDRLDAAVTTIPQQLATDVENTIQSLGGIAAPGAWTSPALSGVQNLGSGFVPAGYAKTANWVELVGTIQGIGAGAVAVGTTPFILPVGFRPLTNHVFACGGDGFKRVDVNSSGAVIINTALVAGTGFVDLSTIRFRIDR